LADTFAFFDGTNSLCNADNVLTGVNRSTSRGWTAFESIIAYAQRFSLFGPAGCIITACKLTAWIGRNLFYTLAGRNFEAFVTFTDRLSFLNVAARIRSAFRRLAGVDWSAFISSELESDSACTFSSTIFNSAYFTTVAGSFLAWVDLDTFVGSFAFTKFESFLATANGLAFNNITFLVRKVLAARFSAWVNKDAAIVALTVSLVAGAKSVSTAFIRAALNIFAFVNWRASS